MRPVFCMLFLTMQIGAGQTLFLTLFTVQVYALLGPLQYSGLPAEPRLFLAQAKPPQNPCCCSAG